MGGAGGRGAARCGVRGSRQRVRWRRATPPVSFWRRSRRSSTGSSRRCVSCSRRPSPRPPGRPRPKERSPQKWPDRPGTIRAMKHDDKQAIALWRLGVLGPLTSARLEHGDRRRYFAEAAARTHERPDGTRVQLSARTIEAWYYAYRRGGFEALFPQIARTVARAARSGRGRRARPARQARAATALHPADHPHARAGGHRAGGRAAPLDRAPAACRPRRLRAALARAGHRASLLPARARRRPVGRRRPARAAVSRPTARCARPTCSPRSTAPRAT